MPPTEPSFTIRIISKDGVLRNPSLLEKARSLGKQPELILNGLPNLEIDFSRTRLTRNEYNCKLNHHRSIFNFPKDCEWILVFEDDADFDTKEMLEFLGKLDGSQFTRATILSLYCNPFALVSKMDQQHGMWQCKVPPPVAVGYLVHRAIMQYAEYAIDTIYPADWPAWARHVDFLIPTKSIVWEIGATSTLEESRITRREQRSRHLAEALSLACQAPTLFLVRFLIHNHYYRFITKFRMVFGFRYFHEVHLS